jgi:hypothetical protein
MIAIDPLPVLKSFGHSREIGVGKSFTGRLKMKQYTHKMAK